MTSTPQTPPASRSAPLVLFGALRSGTTLLRLLLDHHPRLLCPGERDFMLDALRRTPGGSFELDAEVLRESRIFLSSGLSLPETTDGRAAFDSLWAEDQARDPAAHHVLVAHHGIDVLLDLYPDTRFIHLLRDPRDVARSSIGMGWAGNTWYGVDHWIQTETTWDRCMARMPDEQVFTLSYEDLIRAPEETLSALCAFVGVDYDPAMLGFHKTTTYAPIDIKLVEQWRRKQTEDEIADVEYKVWDLMQARGYTPAVTPRRAPIAARRAALWVQSKTKVWAERIKRYGLKDSILVMLSRRLGLPDLGRAARARVRENEKARLK